MALPVNIEDLINKNKVESTHIEFKEGWNPDSIYRSICAFANDFDNIGGGYILVGIKENNGIAERPVKGLLDEELDKIQKEMVGFNNLIKPFYAPRISIEKIDDKNILVIWIPAGNERPYQVPKEIKAKVKTPAYFVRYGTSSIEAKGEILDELRDMADRTPFDDRGNPNIKAEDISLVLLRDYLVQVKSRLAEDLYSQPITQILERMDLITGPAECKMIKNVAAMMFCDHPEKYFPVTQCEIILSMISPNLRFEKQKVY